MTEPKEATCCQHTCDEAATTEVVGWPGAPTQLMCTAHSAKAVGVAQALGFGLLLKPIGYATND